MKKTFLSFLAIVTILFSLAGFNAFADFRAEFYKNPVFNPAVYLSIYDDLGKAFGTDLKAACRHWTDVGLAKEGRMGSFAFDPAYYLGIYPDLQQAFGPKNFEQATQHWLANGIYEGRRSSPIFDVRWYLNHYTDLQQAFGSTNYASAIHHWLQFGIHEGRQGSEDVNIQAIYNAAVQRNPSLQKYLEVGENGANDWTIIWLFYLSGKLYENTLGNNDLINVITTIYKANALVFAREIEVKGSSNNPNGIKISGGVTIDLDKGTVIASGSAQTTHNDVTVGATVQYGTAWQMSFFGAAANRSIEVSYSSEEHNAQSGGASNGGASEVGHTSGEGGGGGHGGGEGGGGESSGAGGGAAGHNGHGGAN